jgi:glycosyltransferase involved in cell wall biosynthesis
MRILLLSDAYPPMIGGATRAAQQLARQLSLRHHDVTVATAWQRDLPSFEIDGSVGVHRLRGVVSRAPVLSNDPVRYTPPPFPDPELVWRFRRLIHDVDPEIIHAYGWITYSLVPALARTEIPVLLAAREYAYVCPIRTLVRRGKLCSGPEVQKCLECAGSFYGQPKASAAVAGVLAGRHLLRTATTWLHSTSSFTDEVMRRHLTDGWNVPHTVIPDFREDDLTGPPDREILGRLPSEPYILFVGAFRAIKGIEVLLGAYRRLDNPPPLVLIGARSREPMPHVPAGVTVLVDVPHDTVMAAWDGALFGVAPSIVPEALGNVVHEAMSRGRAVIGTSPGGHADMIDHGVSGLLAPAGDVDALMRAMEVMIEDSALREQMGEAARRSSGAFTDAVVVPRFEQLYRDVIARAARKSQR